MVRHATMSESREHLGVVSLDVMRRIGNGMTPAQIIVAIGEPFQRLSPAEAQTPSDIFAELGSSFEFASDRGLNEVWSYQHDRRRKFKLRDRVTSFLAFRDGVLCSQWRSYQKIA